MLHIIIKEKIGWSARALASVTALYRREALIFGKHATISTVPIGGAFLIFHGVLDFATHEAIVTSFTLAVASSWERVQRDLEALEKKRKGNKGE